MKYKLQFRPQSIPRYAKAFQYPAAPQVERKKQGGSLNWNELEAVAKWKSPRSAGRVENNSKDYVKAVSAVSFKTKNERLRIESLTLLDGVSWPTASAILHLYHTDPYPILDRRVLWSLSIEVPKPYTFDFWWEYTEICRSLAAKYKTDMRTLDKALWQYSKENQGAL